MIAGISRGAFVRYAIVFSFIFTCILLVSIDLYIPKVSCTFKGKRLCFTAPDSVLEQNSADDSYERKNTELEYQYSDHVNREQESPLKYQASSVDQSWGGDDDFTDVSERGDWMENSVTLTGGQQQTTMTVLKNNFGTERMEASAARDPAIADSLRVIPGNYEQTRTAEVIPIADADIPEVNPIEEKRHVIYPTETVNFPNKFQNEDAKGIATFVSNDEVEAKTEKSTLIKTNFVGHPEQYQLPDEIDSATTTKSSLQKQHNNIDGTFDTEIETDEIAQSTETDVQSTPTVVLQSDKPMAGTTPLADLVQNDSNSVDQYSLRMRESEDINHAMTQGESDMMSENYKLSENKYPTVLESDALKASPDFLRTLNSNTNCSSKSFPSAVVIGVAKSGTGALGFFLSQHPNISMQLETGYIGFFSHNFNKGKQWYLDRLPCSTTNQITIEKSNMYFRSNIAPRNVKSFNKSMKILLILRDPTTRVISQYLQMLDTRPSTINDTFENTVYDYKRNKVREDSRLLIKSLYSRFLSNWLSVFDRSQIHIIDSDIFKTDPVRELSKIEKFLGIDAYFKPEHFPTTERGFHCARMPDSVACLTDAKGRRHPDVDPKVFTALQDYFRPYNKKLFEQIGHLLKNWY